MSDVNYVAIREHAQTSIYCGLRGKTIQVTALLGLILMGVAFLAATFSPRQPQTVALDVGFSFIRITLVLLGVFWVQELVAKEIDRRIVILTIAYPSSRASYVIGRYIGLLFLSALALILLALLLMVIVFFVGKGYEQEFQVALGMPYWGAILGIWLDVAVVIAFVLLISTLSTVSVLPMALGLAFAIGGRALGAAREYINSGADGQQALVNQMAPVLNAIHWVMPDLSRLDWRGWSLYKVFPGFDFIFSAVFSGILYIAFMVILAVKMFSRREFS